MRSNDSPDPAHIPVVAAALRTPIGRINGSLAAIEPAGLAAPLIRHILAETGLAPEAVDDVILGNAANSGRMIFEVDPKSAIAETFAQLSHVVTGRVAAKKPKRAGLGAMLSMLRKRK